MEFDTLNENLEMMIARLELEGEPCGLKHSKEDSAENHPATNYLCQRLGDQETGVPLQELRIPICEECAAALYDEDWILVYCTYCHKSQWIFRPQAKNNYPDGNLIYWLDLCPFCAEVMGEYKEK